MGIIILERMDMWPDAFSLIFGGNDLFRLLSFWCVSPLPIFLHHLLLHTSSSCLGLGHQGRKRRIHFFVGLWKPIVKMCGGNGSPHKILVGDHPASFAPQKLGQRNHLALAFASIFLSLLDEHNSFDATKGQRDLFIRPLVFPPHFSAG